MNTTIIIPFAKGLSLAYEPGHEEELNVALSHFADVIKAIENRRNSPLLSEFMDTVLARFLRETAYSVKSKSMITARFQKIRQILLDGNSDRKVSELNETDARKLKDSLPTLLRKNARSDSQGTNIEIYYRLFNRIAEEALNDRFISKPLKISATRTKKSKISKPFSDADLKSLFDSWPYRKNEQIANDAHSYRFWLMPLALFTGGRLNELCQLRAHDIYEDSHGVATMSINDNGFNKALKNEQSRREIPICSALRDMGFLDFVKERRLVSGNDGLLFAELTYQPTHHFSREPSRFYCGVRTGEGFIGAACPHTIEGGWNFKSFRRTFVLRLEASGVPSSTIAYLLGHRSAAPEVTNRHYLNRPQSLAMRDHLEQGLAYKVHLAHVTWANYSELRKAQVGRKKRGRRRSKGDPCIQP